MAISLSRRDCSVTANTSQALTSQVTAMLKLSTMAELRSKWINITGSAIAPEISPIAKERRVRSNTGNPAMSGYNQ